MIYPSDETNELIVLIYIFLNMLWFQFSKNRINEIYFFLQKLGLAVFRIREPVPFRPRDPDPGWKKIQIRDPG
jgi:hypothetical protein